MSQTHPTATRLIHPPEPLAVAYPDVIPAQVRVALQVIQSATIDSHLVDAAIRVVTEYLNTPRHPVRCCEPSHCESETTTHKIP